MYHAILSDTQIFSTASHPCKFYHYRPWKQASKLTRQFCRLVFPQAFGSLKESTYLLNCQEITSFWMYVFILRPYLHVLLKPGHKSLFCLSVQVLQLWNYLLGLKLVWTFTPGDCPDGHTSAAQLSKTALNQKSSPEVQAPFYQLKHHFNQLNFRKAIAGILPALKRKYPQTSKEMLSYRKYFAFGMFVFRLSCVWFYLTEKSRIRTAVSFLGYNLIQLAIWLGENLSRQKVEPAAPLAQRVVWSRSMPEAVATPHSAGLCRYCSSCEH